MGKRSREPRRAAAPAGRQHSLAWLQGLVVGALVTLATADALLLAALLAPAMVAFVIDRAPGRPVARSVALCGMAACVGPELALWGSGHDLATATGLLADLWTVGVAWTACAAGWLVAELAPVAMRAVLDALGLARAARLRVRLARLAEEWGPPGQ
jgi:hypothetical protein